MKLHVICCRILSTIVLIWVNFLNSILLMKTGNTNRTYKAFLNNTPNKNSFTHFNKNNATPTQILLKNNYTNISTKNIAHLNPFNQSSKEILSDLTEDNSNKDYINSKINNNSNISTHNSTISTNLNKASINYRPNKSVKPISEKMKIEYECESVKYIKANPEDSEKLENFDKVWNAIVTMRNNSDAPVDSMGAHCLADKNADIETQRFQYLVACLLSSQTKDKNTSEAVNNLRNNGLLNIDNILSSNPDELDKHITMVGFHNTKARNLKKICEILKNKFNGKVPDNINDLTSLPGIGPKMAHLILQLGFNKVDGIAVDVHVNRIANRLGWVKTKNPEETRVELEKIIPKKFWAQLNVLLVGFGQLICTKAGPGCSTCLANSYCPVGRGVLK